MATEEKPKILPSTRWSSFRRWNYSGMRERLKGHIEKLDTSILARHAQQILGQKVTISDPFSAGQYWICFEMVAEDGSLIIARVRLPRHPSLPATCSDEDERYLIDCEVATMNFVRQNLPGVKIPRLYAYEGAASSLAAAAGAAYMLLEGFYGNTLQDIEFDICNLPEDTLEHIMTQWTRAQAEIATLSFPCIGSISSVSATGEPVIGRLATAMTEGFVNHGPFSSAAEYFHAVADTAVSKLDLSDATMPWATLGTLVFRDIVQSTTLYADSSQRFPLNHMDLGTQNILIDDDFNFLAIIDWEFAQAAPWPVNYYPMPFPLVESDAEIQSILRDPTHLAHKNVSRQESARRLYVQKFQVAETALRNEGRIPGGSFAAVLDSPPSRIYTCFARLGRLPMADEALVHEMVRLAFNYDIGRAKEYLHDIEGKAR